MAMRNGLKSFVLTIYGICGGAFPASLSTANAEVIERYAPIIVDTQYPTIFALVGEIDSRTALNFERAIDEFGEPDSIVLASDGGLVSQALLISRRIHSLEISTFIPENESCFSACALLFLAGKVRAADGDLGVHQIWSESGSLRDGQFAISDILDVLGEYNVPNNLLVDMFRTPPERMYVLSDEEKQQYAFVFPRSTNLDRSLPVETQAVNFMDAYNKAWSSENSYALEYIAQSYSDSVNFFGSELSRAAVIAEKSAFVRRWPERSYRLVGDTVSASCNASYCYVNGNVEWFAESPERNATSVGLALFEVTLRIENDSFQIVSESGRVLERY